MPEYEKKGEPDEEKTFIAASTAVVASEPRPCPPPTAEELANKSQAEQERIKRKFE